MQIEIDESVFLKDMNVQQMRNNVRMQVESKLAAMIEEQIADAITAKVQTVLDSTDFKNKVEALLVEVVQGSNKVVFSRPRKR